MTTAHSSEAVEVLVLRLQAPLMSFGGVAVDEIRPTREMPGRSLLTGLLGNALGWHHRDSEALQRLQQRLVYAVRQDDPGQYLEDFHTVDLGQSFLSRGWTTRGAPEGRGSGSATSGTHIRQLHYLADAAYTVALTLSPAEEQPTLEALHAALARPARPLFLGRKTCLPSRPLVGHRGECDRLTAASPLEALTRIPQWHQSASQPAQREPAGGNRGEDRQVWWPGAPAGAAPSRDEIAAVGALGVRFDRSLPVTDERDWHHQFHAGRRFLNEGSLPWPPAVAKADTKEGGADG